MTGEDPPETIVFDTEPPVAYFCDDPGSDTVETYVEAVEGTSDGYVSAVDLAEVHYVVRAIDGGRRADAVVDVLAESGIRRVDTADTWRRAAEFKLLLATTPRRRRGGTPGSAVCWLATLPVFLGVDPATVGALVPLCLGSSRP